MDDKGWITLHRKMLKNPIVCKDSDYFAVWVYLLLNATHKDVSALFKGKRITLKPGQLITGSKSIGEQFNINYVKVHRILKVFESEKQIEKQSSNKNSLITIVNWHLYQDYEKQIEIQVKNNCNSSEIQVKTNNNDNNVNNITIIKDIVGYLNRKVGSNFKYSSKKTKSLINARLNEGFKPLDFKQVIDNKTQEWLNDKKMSIYLRPETLFGTKFESYLNQKTKRTLKDISINELEGLYE